MAVVLVLWGGIQYLLSQPEPEGFPILEYHMVQQEDSKDAYAYNVPVEDFQQQLDYLQEQGYTTISIRDYCGLKRACCSCRKSQLFLPLMMGTKAIIRSFCLSWRSGD